MIKSNIVDEIILEFEMANARLTDVYNQSVDYIDTEGLLFVVRHVDGKTTVDETVHIAKTLYEGVSKLYVVQRINDIRNELAGFTIDAENRYLLVEDKQLNV